MIEAKIATLSNEFLNVYRGNIKDKYVINGGEQKYIKGSKIAILH